MTEEEKTNVREQEVKDLTVATNKKGGAKKIEIVGIDQSYNWRSEISTSKDITIQIMKISDIGPPSDYSQPDPKHHAPSFGQELPLQLGLVLPNHFRAKTSQDPCSYRQQISKDLQRLF